MNHDPTIAELDVLLADPNTSPAEREALDCLLRATLEAIRQEQDKRKGAVDIDAL